MTHPAPEQEPAGPRPAAAPPQREPAGGQAAGAVPDLLLLQQAAGNQMVNRMVDRDAAPPGRVLAREVDYQALADDYEADAFEYWDQNMRMELETAAGTEGAAIGRRAGVTAAAEVRRTCEPFEEDQENDTQVLSTIFAVTGGGLTMGEAGTSGTSSVGANSGLNIASRATRAAMGIVSVWLPTLAGYRTVGQLKAAASRQAEEAGAQGGETASGTFGEYQTEVMTALEEDFRREVAGQKQRIVRDQIDELGVRMAKGMFSTWRGQYLTRLRSQYGAGSPVGTSVQQSIVRAMAPRMAELRRALDAAKERRQSAQQTTGIIGGIIGGAVTGAVIGGVATSWTGPGAIIGGVVGGVVGGIVGGVGAAFMGD